MSEVAIKENSATTARDGAGGDRLRLSTAAVLVAIAGFIALAYEIVWYRLFSFWSASNARVFAILLGAYLTGVAVGGLAVHDLTTSNRHRTTPEYLRLVAAFVAAASLIAITVAPAMALTAASLIFSPALMLVAVSAALMGAVFPLICHVSVSNEANAGFGTSLLYFSNIVGCALGSFLIGFVIMNVSGIRIISVMLALMGLALAGVLLIASRPSRRVLELPLLLGAALGVGLIAVANPAFKRIYERLLEKNNGKLTFAHLVENRSGVIAVSQDGTVFGGGIYDGVFNVDPMHDVNGINRIYALSAFDPQPSRVLMIGLPPDHGRRSSQIIRRCSRR